MQAVLLDIIEKMNIFTLFLSITGSILVSNFISGMLFYFDKNYNENDLCFISGVGYRIVKIGILRTTFYRVDKERTLLLSIYNSRIQYFNIEKVIDD